MGGGGEGLVAVIRALPAGMSVVLLDRKRQELDRQWEQLDFRRRLGRRGLKELKSSRALDLPHRRSAGVGTDLAPKTNTSSQICDGQYASTYQLAHCSLTPTSPPIDLPEFPPQRPEPSRNHGNFVVGGFGSGERYRSHSPSPPSHEFKGGIQWPDRGAVCSPRPQDDAFANSLRKYPNGAEGSLSTELIQRLIRSSQAKFVPKSTHHSKSLRNLGDKSPTHSKINFKKSSKNLQTYTRSRKHESEREQTVTNYTVRRSNTKPKGFKGSGILQSPGCSKEVRAKETFDYLNSSIPRPPPGKARGDRSAVRDSIRDSLRAVYGDGRGPVAAFNLCPRIQSRYEKHRREHHGAEASKRDSLNEAHGLKVHSLDRRSSDLTCEKISPNPSISRSKVKLNVACECNKPELDPCICPPDKSLVDECICHPNKPGFHKSDNPSNKLKVDKCSCGPNKKKCKLGSFKDDIGKEQELEKIIEAWLEELPVSSKEKRHDKIIRTARTKKLCESLSTMKDDKFDAKVREEILKCIDEIPMWLPHDKDVCDNFKNKIADRLFDKLKDFKHRNTFRYVIEKWLDGINFETEEEIDRDEFTLNLTNVLKKMDRNKSSNEQLYIKKLKCKILDIMEGLPIQTTGDRNYVYEKLTDELTSKLINSEGAKNSHDNPEIDSYVTRIITALNDLPELTNLSIEEKQNAAENLLDKLPEAQFERDDDDDTEELRSLIRFFTIHNWLLQLAKDKKVDISSTLPQSFIKDLILKLEEVHASKNESIDPIMKFLRELPVPTNNNDPEIKKNIEEFSNEIKQLKPLTGEGREENLNELLTTVENWLKKYFDRSGTHVDPKTVPIYAKELAKVISNPKKKITFSSPMLNELLDLKKKSDRPLIGESFNRSNAEDTFKSKFNDPLADQAVRCKDEEIAGELLSVLDGLERAHTSGIISDDTYNKLLSRIHELSNIKDMFDFTSDDTSRKMATSTPQRQSQRRDPSLDDEVRNQRIKSKDKRRSSLIVDKNESLKQPGSSKIKSKDKKIVHEDLHDKIQLIQDWINELKLNLKNKAKDLVNDLANDLVDRRKYLQVNAHAKTSDEEELEHMKYQIFKRLLKLVDTSTINAIMPKVGTLMDSLKEKSGPQLANLIMSTDTSNHVSRPSPSPITQMNDVAKTWRSDDALYDDMPFENIDEQSSRLSMSTDITDNIQADLMRNLNPAKEKLKENVAGQAYKQQLRDIITKSSPSTSNTTEDEQASFEIMKDNLADAYINLHYVADDENLKAKFKNKINKEINKFCNDYLKRHPDKPLSATQLNKDLYSALKNIEAPNDESIRSEVEISRVKDIIDDWAEKLPLPEKSSTEKLQKNKIFTLLAQRLHELENNNELTHDDRYEEKLGHEIEKILKKLPLQNKTNMKSAIDRLIDMVKGTKNSRMFTYGSRRSVDDERYGTQRNRLSLNEERSGPQTSRQSKDKGAYDYSQNGAASSLSRNDQVHLQSIRERTESSQRRISYQDAAVNPPPLDHGSQVNMEIIQNQQAQCSCRCSQLENRSPVVQSPSSSRSYVPMTECRRQPVQVSIGSQIEISPYVVVKEYFWDNPPTPQEPRPPPSPHTPLPALSSCCILPQNKPLPHRQTTKASRNRPPVTVQRSFDRDEYIEACRRPMTPRHCGRPVREELGWECTKDEHKHGSPRKTWSRPHIYRDNERLSPCNSTERKESSVRCGCGGKISRCRVRNPVICQICHDDPMKYCPRCCGTLCPHPTDFYFR